MQPEGHTNKGIETSHRNSFIWSFAFGVIGFDFSPTVSRALFWTPSRNEPLLSFPLYLIAHEFLCL